MHVQLSNDYYEVTHLPALPDHLRSHPQGNSLTTLYMLHEY